MGRSILVVPPLFALLQVRLQQGRFPLAVPVGGRFPVSGGAVPTHRSAGTLDSFLGLLRFEYMFQVAIPCAVTLLPHFLHASAFRMVTPLNPGPSFLPSGH